MRRALIITLILLSLMRLDRRRAKLVLRQTAAFFCRHLLKRLSRPYAVDPATAVIFAPHEDDETLGCGGLIARKRNEGFPVHVVFITDGSASHPGHPRLTANDLAQLRQNEARQAMGILGVESIAIHFLGEPDGTLHQLTPAHRAALVARIAALLRKLQPAEIFAPCSPDGSSEHDSAFTFIVDAVRAADLRPDVWQYPVWSWWNPALLIRHLMTSADRRQAPTEDYAPLKNRALACYRSQTEPLPPQTDAALPGELLQLLNSDVEFFFRHDLPVREPAPATATEQIIVV